MFYVFALLVLFGYGVINYEYTETCDTTEVTNTEGEVISFEQSCSYNLTKKDKP